MLLVYTRRHNGDVGDQERKGFSPLGTAPFSCKYFQKLFIVLNTEMVTLSHGCKPRIKKRNEFGQVKLKFSIDRFHCHATKK